MRRTAVINQIRGLLPEGGITVCKGRCHVHAVLPGIRRKAHFEQAPVRQVERQIHTMGGQTLHLRLTQKWTSKDTFDFRDESGSDILAAM